MANTVTVGAVDGANPSVVPCTINGTNKVNIVVSGQSLRFIPSTEQSAYVQARALLLFGDSSGATGIVTPLVSGNIDTTVDPHTDTRNWAKLWVDGIIIS